MTGTPRRALAGQHSQTPEAIMARLAPTGAGWNAAATPFIWDGKRRERRRRARTRRFGGAAPIVDQYQFIAA